MADFIIGKDITLKVNLNVGRPNRTKQRREIFRAGFEQGFVDRLSLYLTFTDNEDERIQGELENVINEFEW